MREGLLGAELTVPRDTEEPRCPTGGQSDTKQQAKAGRQHLEAGGGKGLILPEGLQGTALWTP